jgi:hypothetical protein
VFEEEASTYLERARPTFIRKTNPQNRSHWLVMFVEDPYPPIELSILIGEFLYSLRSSLDNMICGLVRRTHPTSSCAGRQFPIYDTLAEYLRDRKKCVRGVPKAARTLLDGLQPHCRPPGAVELDPLWILNRLCNRDKHRAVNLTVGYSHDVELLIPFVSGGYHHVHLKERVYLGDVETIALPGDPDSMGNSVTIRGRSNLTLVGGERWADRPVNEVLGACLH